MRIVENKPGSPGRRIVFVYRVSHRGLALARAYLSCVCPQRGRKRSRRSSTRSDEKMMRSSGGDSAESIRRETGRSEDSLY